MPSFLRLLSSWVVFWCLLFSSAIKCSLEIIWGGRVISRPACVGETGYFFLPGRWVSADAATLLTAFGVFGLLSSLPALDATFLDVVSFLAIVIATFLALLTGGLRFRRMEVHTNPVRAPVILLGLTSPRRRPPSGFCLSRPCRKQAPLITTVYKSTTIKQALSTIHLSIYCEGFQGGILYLVNSGESAQVVRFGAIVV